MSPPALCSAWFFSFAGACLYMQMEVNSISAELEQLAPMHFAACHMGKALASMYQYLHYLQQLL